MQMEKEAHKEHIGKLNEKIEHANIEHQKVCGGDRLGLWSNFAVFFFPLFCFGFLFFCNSEIISHKGLGNSYVFFWLFLSSYKTAPNYSGRDGGKVSYSGLCLLYSCDYLPLRAKVFCVIQLIWKWCYCRKQVLQTGCDDQSLRLSDLQQQYEFKCNEIEVCTVPVLYLMIWSFGLITWDVNNVN